jgi:hypothetical protein
VGEVQKIITRDQNQTSTIIFENYGIFKQGLDVPLRWVSGVIEVGGFAGESSCGPAPPKVGDTIYVFVCPNKDRSTWGVSTENENSEKRYWKLNQFVFGAGVINTTNKPRLSRNIFNTIRRLKRNGELTSHGSCNSERHFFSRAQVNNN